MATFPVASTQAITNVAPNPAYTGRFIPALWSGKLIEKFYDATVLAAIANTDYAGEIKSMGDTVNIRQKPDLEILTYEAGTEIAVERPSSNIVTLEINTGKYFAAIVDDVMETQSDLNMLGMWADDASEQMKIAIDNDVLGGIATDVVAANKGTTAGAITSGINLGVTTTPLEVVGRAPTGGQVEAIDVLLRLGQALDEQNIPESGRWAVIPAWFAAQIKRSELRDASLTGDGATMLRNGRLGMIDRFTLYVSNASNLKSGTEYTIHAGHSHGLTFASQLTRMETMRSERTFGTIMRGLQVYGYKVTDGTAIASAVVDQP